MPRPARAAPKSKALAGSGTSKSDAATSKTAEKLSPTSPPPALPPPKLIPPRLFRMPKRPPGNPDEEPGAPAPDVPVEAQCFVLGKDEEAAQITVETV